MWLDRTGREMLDEHWLSDDSRCLGMHLPAEAADDVDEVGRPIPGDTLLVLFNAGDDENGFVLGPLVRPVGWECLIDTFDRTREGVKHAAGSTYSLAPRSVALFRAVPSSGPVEGDH